MSLGVTVAYRSVCNDLHFSEEAVPSSRLESVSRSSSSNGEVNQVCAEVLSRGVLMLRIDIKVFSVSQSVL